MKNRSKWVWHYVNLLFYCTWPLCGACKVALSKKKIYPTNLLVA